MSLCGKQNHVEKCSIPNRMRTICTWNMQNRMLVCSMCITAHNTHTHTTFIHPIVENLLLTNFSQNQQTLCCHRRYLKTKMFAYIAHHKPNCFISFSEVCDFFSLPRKYNGRNHPFVALPWLLAILYRFDGEWWTKKKWKTKFKKPHIET